MLAVADADANIIVSVIAAVSALGAAYISRQTVKATRTNGSKMRLGELVEHLYVSLAEHRKDLGEALKVLSEVKQELDEHVKNPNPHPTRERRPRAAKAKAKPKREAS